MSKKVARGNSRELDQFYTDPKYAANFLKKIEANLDLNSADILLEPSAGSGNFYSLLDKNKRLGLDLDPKLTGIKKQDFFKYTPKKNSKVITIGNPPFGKNANLAVKFFNHAAEFSDAIAFVLPRTFRKASIINRLNKHFHLVYDETVPDHSFIFNDAPYDVWCCAQIWVRKTTPRAKVPVLNFALVKSWFEIVEPSKADFSIQRVGGRAGMIRTTDFAGYSSQSHYFIKQKDTRVLDAFKKIDFGGIKNNTAGNPSISPSELIELWIESANSLGIQIDSTTKSFNKFFIEG